MEVMQLKKGNKERWERIIQRLEATSKEIETLTPTMLEVEMEDIDLWYIADNLRWASRWAEDSIELIKDAMAANEGLEALYARIAQH